CLFEMSINSTCHIGKIDTHLALSMNEPIALCNALIIGLTCLVSWLGFRSRALEEKYIFEPEGILAWKEYYRLLTSGFLHAGWWHLLVNMVSLYLLGRYVELLFGAGHFL